MTELANQLQLEADASYELGIIDTNNNDESNLEDAIIKYRKVLKLREAEDPVISEKLVKAKDKLRTLIVKRINKDAKSLFDNACLDFNVFRKLKTLHKCIATCNDSLEYKGNQKITLKLKAKAQGALITIITIILFASLFVILIFARKFFS